MSAPYGVLPDGKIWYDTRYCRPLLNSTSEQEQFLRHSIEKQHNMRPYDYDKDHKDGFMSGGASAAPATDPPIATTKERVLAAAAKCSDAARVLKELFPEAFEKPEKPLGALEGVLKIGVSAHGGVRILGDLAYKGFWLDGVTHAWAIVTDSEGEQVLVPTPKR